MIGSHQPLPYLFWANCLFCNGQITFVQRLFTVMSSRLQTVTREAVTLLEGKPCCSTQIRATQSIRLPGGLQRNLMIVVVGWKFSSTKTGS